MFPIVTLPYSTPHDLTRPRKSRQHKTTLRTPINCSALNGLLITVNGSIKQKTGQLCLNCWFEKRHSIFHCIWHGRRDITWHSIVLHVAAGYNTALRWIAQFIVNDPVVIIPVHVTFHIRSRPSAEFYNVALSEFQSG